MATRRLRNLSREAAASTGSGGSGLRVLISRGRGMLDTKLPREWARARRARPLQPGRHDSPPVVLHFDHPPVEQKRDAPLRRLPLEPVHEFSGSAPRVEELFGQGLGSRSPRSEDRFSQGHLQGKALDSLPRPIGREVLAGYGPDLPGVDVEEDPVQPAAEAIDDPALERPVVGRPGDPVLEVAPRRTGRSRSGRGSGTCRERTADT